MTSIAALFCLTHQEFHAVICATFYSPWPRWQSRWLIMITMFSFYLALTSQRRDKLLSVRVSRWDWGPDHQGVQKKLRFGYFSSNRFCYCSFICINPAKKRLYIENGAICASFNALNKRLLFSHGFAIFLLNVCVFTTIIPLDRRLYFLFPGWVSYLLSSVVICPGDVGQDNTQLVKV